MIRVLILCLCCLIFWALPAAGSGPGPYDTQDAEEAFSHSVAVFLGTVIATDNSYGRGSIADVYIQKIWKGVELFEITRVRVNGGQDRVFEVDKKYLFCVSFPRAQQGAPAGGINIIEFSGSKSMSRIVSYEEAESDLALFDKMGREGVDVRDAPFPKWQACTKDIDCTVVEAECPGWKPVNRIYLSQMEAHMAYKRPMVDCATYELPAMPVVGCVYGMCREKR